MKQNATLRPASMCLDQASVAFDLIQILWIYNQILPPVSGSSHMPPMGDQDPLKRAETYFVSKNLLKNIIFTIVPRFNDDTCIDKQCYLCMNLTHFGSCFETIRNVSASQLEILVTGLGSSKISSHRLFQRPVSQSS